MPLFEGSNLRLIKNLSGEIPKLRDNAANATKDRGKHCDHLSPAKM